MKVCLVTIDPKTRDGMVRLLDWLIETHLLRGVPDPDGDNISIKYTPKGLIGELDERDVYAMARFGIVTVHGRVEIQP